MVNRRIVYCLLLLVVLTFFAVQVLAQVEEPPTNIAIIMDASGSMQALLEDGRSRIAIARDEIITLSNELSPTVNASLWVYGHRLSQDDPAASCLDIEEIIPLAPPDATAFTSTVNSVNAIGYTPIATTLGMVYSSLPADERDIMVLMSDGEESCGGDPCNVASELDARNIELRIHTIGFAADAGTRAQLQCIADVTGGNYYEAQDTEGLRQALRAATAPITGMIAVVRSDGEIATGVGFSVVDSSGQTVGSVVGSGSFAPGDYTVTVNTEPPLEAAVTVIAGETATIQLPELGIVRLVNANGDVLDQFTLTALRPETDDIIGFGAEGTVQLPPGQYDIAVGDMTDQWESVTLTAGETVDIVVDFGTVQLVDANGNPTDVYSFNIYQQGGIEVVESVTTGNTNILAGTYDAEVQTNPRFRQTITVTAGETTNIQLGGIGTLELVDESGARIGDYSFQALPEGGDVGQTITATDGVVDLLAGNYGVEVQSNPPLSQTVTITAGQTTQIVMPSLGTIQLIDVDGNPISEYSMYIYTSDTDAYIASTFSGSLQVAAGTYNIEVYTNPTIEQSVTVTAGETTNVQLGGIGNIQVLDANGNLADDYAFYVYSEDSNTSLMGGFGTTEIAAGTYRVEVYTNPISTFEVTVNAGETATIQLGGIGMIEVVDADGNLADDYAFYVYPESGDTMVVAGFGSTDIAAGTYRVEVYTNPYTIQTVTVGGGETTQLQLGGMGTVQLVDASGAPLTDESFYIYAAGETAMINYATSSIIMLEGDYEVEPSNTLGTRYPVTVTAGEITEVEVNIP